MQEQKRYEWIDSIKGVSILGVILIHSGAMSLGGIVGRMAQYGSSFVQAFFVISAMLVWKSLDKYEGGLSLSDSLKWILKKILSILPLYYLSLILYALITGGSAYWAGSDKPITVSNVLTHIFFIHGLFPRYCNSIIGVEWYLGVLIIFYFVAVPVHRLINSLPKALIGFVVINLSSYYGCMWMSSLSQDREWGYIYSEYYNSYGFFSQLPSLAIGVVLYYIISRGGRTNNISNNKVAGISISITSLILALVVLKKYGAIEPFIPFFKLTVPTLYAISFAIFIYGQGIYAIPIINNKLFAFIGKQSLGIYLLHCLIIFIYDRYANFTFASNMVCWVIKYLIVLVISIAISVLIGECHFGRKDFLQVQKEK